MNSSDRAGRPNQENDSSMSRLLAFFARERRLFIQARELAALRDEVQMLRAQNAKINKAMRRCITCDYRLKVVSSN
jgi:hypothetical protein